MAMFLIHVEAKINTYHNFDRFVYAQAGILLGSKIFDQQVATPLIINAFRAAMRKINKRGGEDHAERLRLILYQVNNAETMLLVNLGFDLKLEIGMNWLNKWETKLGGIESTAYQNAAVSLSQLYQTTLCIYYEPEILALTGLLMSAKNMSLTPELMGWNAELLKYFKSRR